jgi:hypothetical protein
MNLLVFFSFFCGFFSNKLLRRRSLWHKNCFHDLCQPADFTEHLFNIIPKNIDPSDKQSPADFTRDRHLTFPKLITFVLSLASSGTNQGVDTKSNMFFKNARRSGVWLDATAVHRSSVSRARRKVPWQVFCDILTDAVELAYQFWPQHDDKYLWHGMSVYALDGSKYNLPATDEIRQTFDPNSGLENDGKGHYPQCLVSTVYDVFRRLPIARTVVKHDSCEREEIKKLLPFVPEKSVWMFDRGYPSYESILYLKQNYPGYFLFRSPATSTFPAVASFIKGGKKEAVIWITPSNTFKRKVSIGQRRQLNPIKLRIIRLESPDGTLSVLLTNLFGKKKYTFDEIINLYFQRWEVENYYRDEKVILDIEKFHSETANGILQELYAVMIMSVITRTTMALSAQWFYSGKQELQFKNAILTLASDAAFLVADDPEKAAVIFKEIIAEISRVKYYRPKNQRASQPRVNKQPVNKWNQSKIKKSAACT